MQSRPFLSRASLVLLFLAACGEAETRQVVASDHAALNAGEYTLFAGATAPTTAHPDPSAVEVGVKFRSDVSGRVLGIRFHKLAGNDGTHTGTLWSATGEMLAQATFTNETESGWQEVRFAQPVDVQANTTYVASYHAPSGYYSATNEGFSSSVDAAPLHAPSSDEAGGNGVYVYGPSGFPTESYRASNYWVDVIFATDAVTRLSPPSQLSARPVDSTSIDLVWVRSVQNNGEVQWTPAAHHLVFRDGVLIATVPGTQANFRDTGLDPSSTHAYTIRGQDTLGLVSAPSNTSSATTSSDAPCNPCSLWTEETGRPRVQNADRSPTELGLKFRASVAGAVTGVRFYKGSLDTAEHVGHLWSVDGQLLATTEIQPGDTGFGWRELAFTSPVAIAADTVYVVSYFASAGGYALSNNYFDWAGVNAGPLQAPSAAEVGGNGVRHVGGSAFPTETWLNSNYWVDVVFAPTP